jgi:hypothetical protein
LIEDPFSLMNGSYYVSIKPVFVNLGWTCSDSLKGPPPSDIEGVILTLDLALGNEMASNSS